MNILNISYIIFNFLLFFYFRNISDLINIYDKSGGRKIHRGNISLAGGIFVFISIFSFISISKLYEISFFNQLLINETQTLIFLLTSCMFFLIGLVDDKKDLSSKYKIFLFLIFIIFYLNFDPSLVLEILFFSFVDKIILLQSASFVFTLICIIIFINAFNMYDGSNGQIGIYSLIFLLYISFKLQNLDLLIITIPIILFLILNFKSKTFLGNSGSYFLGFLFSFIIIKTYKLDSNNLKADEVVLLMFYPIFDLTRLFVLRLINNKNPFIGDRQHIHHYLLNKFKKNYIVQIYLFILVILPIIIYETFKINLILILIINLIIYLSVTIKTKNSKNIDNG
jgi:UDP-GlcNAc:undecaprenyl-phosphate GlcNAc-1-phosphate transferase